LAGALKTIAKDAERKSAWLGRPLYWLRILALLMIIAILAGLVGQFLLLDWRTDDSIDWTELVQGMEAAVNEIVLISAAIFFMITLENRYKRRKGLKAIHETPLDCPCDRHAPTDEGSRANRKASPIRQQSLRRQ
jgi:hypothetical protein